MRIAIGGFCHETNSFSSVTVSFEQLMASTREKETLIRAYTGAHSYVGGFIDEAAELGVEIVPALQTSLKPSGPCTAEGFEYSRDRLAELLAESYETQPYDGIALFMHGGGAVPGYPDPEGNALRAIRERMGREIPIGVVLDLHGNISQDMIELSDLLTGCKHYPHIDEYDQGRVMFRLLCDKIEKGYTIYKRVVRMPWLMVPAQGVTLSGPAHDIQSMCFEREKTDPDLLQAAFFQGFPYTDVPDCCVSIVTMAKSQESADRNGYDIARYAWSRRKDTLVPVYSAEEAVAMALAAPEGPVLINETSDNPGGGTPGDGTHLLREMLKANVPAAYGFIFDPETAEQAAKAGAGARIRCRIGGKTDSIHGKPVEVEAYVHCVSDGAHIRKSPIGLGGRNSLGTTACLEVGNVSIVVASFRTQTFDDGPFLTAGVDWTQKRIVALKSSQHFKGWWKDKVKTIIPCDSPGLQCADLTTFNFQMANAGFFPLKDIDWDGVSDISTYR